MPSPIAFELRERAVTAYEAGEGSYEEISERFLIGRRPLQRWVSRKRTTGSVAAKPRGGGTRSLIRLATLETLVAKHPDASTYELTAQYNRQVPRHERTHRSSIRRALARAGFVLKKNESGRPSWTGLM
jgi:transposase